MCDACGAMIHCSDSDNIVENLCITTTMGIEYRGRYYIDFKEMYKLTNAHFSLLKEKIGFDVFKQYSNQTIDLKEVIKVLEKEYNINPEEEKLYTFDRIKMLPKIINKWYSIIEALNQ